MSLAVLDVGLVSGFVQCVPTQCERGALGPPRVCSERMIAPDHHGVCDLQVLTPCMSSAECTRTLSAGQDHDASQYVVPTTSSRL